MKFVSDNFYYHTLRCVWLNASGLTLKALNIMLTVGMFTESVNNWFLAGFFDEKFRLIDWCWAGGIHNKVKVLVKVLFSDNNSDVFEWN